MEFHIENDTKTIPELPGEYLPDSYAIHQAIVRGLAAGEITWGKLYFGGREDESFTKAKDAPDGMLDVVVRAIAESLWRGQRTVAGNSVAALYASSKKKKVGKPVTSVD